LENLPARRTDIQGMHMQARKRLREILGEIMADRRARGDQQGSGGDILGGLMRAAALTDDQVADNVIGVLFAAQDTTASMLTWIVKYLHDHPKLLEDVRAEQAAIREANDGGKRPLTWAQTRGMTLTHAVRDVYLCPKILTSLQFGFFCSLGFGHDTHYFLSP
jgi:(+)-abscisic acid 8'-hydroxylase